MVPADDCLIQKGMVPGGIGREGGECGNAVLWKGRENWDEFWGEVGKKESKKCCFVLDLSEESSGDHELPGHESLSMELKIPDDVLRTVVICVPGQGGLKLDLKFIVGWKSRFDFRVRGDLEDGSNLDLLIGSEMSSVDSEFRCMGRFVCRKGSSVSVVTKGFIDESARSGTCIYDMKMLQIGEGGNVQGRPEMEVLSDDVRADHGLSVGRVPEDVLLYAGSRGMSVDGIEKKYAEGFLCFA